MTAIHERDQRATDALMAVTDELWNAMDRFPPFNSAHEGYAVILEELDEMWAEVKHGTTAKARREAIQVAAMAVRFLVDIPDGPRTGTGSSAIERLDL